MDSSSPSGGDMLTCSRPLIERRLRPPHDQSLKCPRCESTHTKFCYYNNYSLSQPRYFCKTCRRYWTKGGTLRNIPVGGGCRKNKKVSSKKSNDPPPMINQNIGSSNSHNPTQLQLSNYPDPVQFSHLNNLGLNNPNFMDMKYNAIPIDFMETKFDFMGNGGDLGMIGGLGDISNSHGLGTSFHGTNLCSPFGMSIDGNIGNFNFPYEGNVEPSGIDVKPNKLLSLEWQDQGCSDAGKDSNFGYFTNGLGSWTGLMNGYGSSAANPLV